MSGFKSSFNESINELNGTASCNKTIPWHCEMQDEGSLHMMKSPNCLEMKDIIFTVDSSAARCQVFKFGSILALSNSIFDIIGFARTEQHPLAVGIRSVQMCSLSALHKPIYIYILDCCQR